MRGTADLRIRSLVPSTFWTLQLPRRGFQLLTSRIGACLSCEGGGIVYLGEIVNGDIEHNSIVLNQSSNRHPHQRRRHHGPGNAG